MAIYKRGADEDAQFEKEKERRKKKVKLDAAKCESWKCKHVEIDHKNCTSSNHNAGSKVEQHAFTNAMISVRVPQTKLVQTTKARTLRGSATNK